jgi:hypothetical protein
MRTPANKDCSYFYEDFNRGADIRQCRIARGEGSVPWQATHCLTCPVPDILAANGNRYLQLSLTTRSSGLFGRKQHFAVESWCIVHGPIEDPYVGCAECNAETGLDLSGLE